MSDERPFGERVAAQVDADLELATRTRLPEEDRELAFFARAQLFDFGDLKQEAVVEVAIPLMVVLAGRGYHHAEQVKMFGPLGGTALEAVTAIAARYRGTIEERGALLVEAVGEGLRGQFALEGESVKSAFDLFWPTLRDMLGNEPRVEAPARDLFAFGAAVYAVETRIVLEMIREERYARAEATIRKNERRRKLRFWAR